MRLSTSAMSAIQDCVNKAKSSAGCIKINAPNRSRAVAMFRAVSPHIEKMGGAPVVYSLSWRFASGGTISVEVSAAVDADEALRA